MPLGGCSAPYQINISVLWWWVLSFTHPAFNRKKRLPDVTDVDVVYSTFYLGYQGVFISSYSQMKSNVSVNDDRAGVNPGGSLKGLSEMSVTKPDRKGRMWIINCRANEDGGQLFPVTIMGGCSEYLRSSHTLFSRCLPGNQQGAHALQQHVQQQRANITPQQLHSKWFGLYWAAPVNEGKVHKYMTLLWITGKNGGHEISGSICFCSVWGTCIAWFLFCVCSLRQDIFNLMMPWGQSVITRKQMQSFIWPKYGATQGNAQCDIML